MNKSVLEEKISIQEGLINFLDNEDNNEDIFQDFFLLLKKYKILDDSSKIKTFLQLLRDISDNHHRNSSFFTKISRILILFKDEIKRIFTNSEIYDFYAENKRILLILIENKILTIDEYFISKIFENKFVEMYYPHYFYPEIKTHIEKQYKVNFSTKSIESIYNSLQPQEALPDMFNEKRNNGENDNFLCELIRQDKIDDFIIYCNQNNLNLTKIIDQSIYETNSFLMGKEITLIEYAAFFGSIQIVQYLRNNKINFTTSFLNFAIHGNNNELLISFLEKNIEDLQSAFIESVKCHHNDIARYIRSNNKDILGNQYLFRYHNYQLINDILYDCDINYKEDFEERFYHKNVGNEFQTSERTLLDMAIEIEDMDIINYILSNENLDINNASIIKSRFSYILDYEIEEDQIEDVYEEEKRTPLIFAIKKGNIEIINLLLKNDKIDVNITNVTIKSAKGIDFYPDFGGIGSSLLEKIDVDEITPLCLAILNKNDTIIKLLLENEKLDVNAISKSDKKSQVDNHGFGDSGSWKKTALHLAIYNGPEIVALLLNCKGIDITIKDNNDHDPIYYAKFVSPEILNLFTKKKNEMNI